MWKAYVTRTVITALWLYVWIITVGKMGYMDLDVAVLFLATSFLTWTLWRLP